MEEAMRRPEDHTPASRQWLSGLVVTVAIVVSYVGFARISVGWTLVLSTLILVGLLFFFWSVGRRKQR